MIQAPTLFPGMVINAPTTEGIKYTGSKLKLLPLILELAGKVDARTVLDGFSGTTRVAQALAKTGYRVIVNDIAVWSEVFGVCYLLNTKQRKDYEELIRHLNSVQPVDGWFTERYGGLPNCGMAVQSDGLKKPWQVHNTRKLDAIRDEIDRLSLAPVEKAVALTSLILALETAHSATSWPIYKIGRHDHTRNSSFGYRKSSSRKRLMKCSAAIFLTFSARCPLTWHISIHRMGRTTRKCHPRGSDMHRTTTFGRQYVSMTPPSYLASRNVEQTPRIRLQGLSLKSFAATKMGDT